MLIPFLHLDRSSVWRRIPQKVVVSLVVCVLGGCTRTIQQHGWIPEGDPLTQVKVGMSRTEVERRLGSPTLCSSFDPHVCYYISRVTSLGASFLRPKVVQSQTYTLIFDDRALLTAISQNGLETAVSVKPVARETPVRGYDPSIWKQLLRNFGRTNSKEGRL